MTSFSRSMVLSVMWSTSVAALEWMELSSAGYVPSERSRHTMTVLHDGRVVMFGGYKYVYLAGEGDYYFNDIYGLTVDGNIATWVWLSSAGDGPGRRDSHTMTLLADGNAVLFGGYQSVGSYSFYYNDIYSLNVSGTTATWVPLSSAGDVPIARCGHTMTLLADGSAVMFGGQYDEWSSLNDIYRLTVSGTIATWVQLSSVGNVPGERRGHTVTVLHDGSAVMYGGYRYDNGFRYLNDIYTLTVDGTIATWVQLSSAGDVPSARRAHTITLLADDRAVMFGGYGGTYFNDIHSLTVSGTTATWVQLSGSGDVPAERRSHTMTMLPDGSVVMFGGYVYSTGGESGYSNDIYMNTLPTAAAVKITLSMTATFTDEEAICETTNLDRGGGTYRSFVDALDAAAVATSGVTFTLTCTYQRNDGLVLVTSVPFTKGETATTFSKSVNASSADVASEFESQIATTLGVNVAATVSGVVLSVKAIDSTTSACHIVLGWTVVAICSLSLFSIPL